jgi:hypothetical protein
VLGLAIWRWHHSIPQVIPQRDKRLNDIALIGTFMELVCCLDLWGMPHNANADFVARNPGYDCRKRTVA